MTDAPKTSSFIPHVPSLAGFWARFFALVLDLVFLHYFFRFCSWGLGDLLFQNERVTAIGSVIVFLFYFASLNGPPGGGSTIGKTILRMRTSTLDGDVPSWGSVMIRTLMFFPFVVTFHVLSMAMPELPQSPGVRFGAMIVTGALAVATMAGNSIAAAFNPFKQGLHDFAAGTVVRTKAETALPFAEMQTTLGQSWMKHYRQPQYSGRVSFFLIFIGLSAILWPVASGSRMPLPPPSGPILEKLSTLSGAHLERAPQFRPNSRDDDSSDTLNVGLALTRPRLWQTPIDDPQLRKDAEAFAYEYLKALADGEFLPLADDFNGTASIEIEFSSEADLILYTATREHGSLSLEVPASLRGNSKMRVSKLN